MKLKEFIKTIALLFVSLFSISKVVHSGSFEDTWFAWQALQEGHRNTVFIQCGVDFEYPIMNTDFKVKKGLFGLQLYELKKNKWEKIAAEFTDSTIEFNNGDRDFGLAYLPKEEEIRLLKYLRKFSPKVEGKAFPCLNYAYPSCFDAWKEFYQYFDIQSQIKAKSIISLQANSYRSFVIIGNRNIELKIGIKDISNPNTIKKVIYPPGTYELENSMTKSCRSLRSLE